MLKLQRVKRPTELTDKLIAELTEEFKNTEKAVWKDTAIGIAIEDALLLMSHHKCCYCECKLKQESNYLNVEHFFPKTLYTDEVLEWDNLFPCCPFCNSKKGKLDTKKEPILKPDKDNPQEHLALEQYFIVGKDELGIRTIEKVDLNAFSERIAPRRAITENYQALASSLLDNVQTYATRKQPNGMQDRRNRIIETTKFILNKCLPSSVYAAYSATRVLNDTRFYQVIKQLMQQENIWTEELALLEQEAKNCALEYILS